MTNHVCPACCAIAIETVTIGCTACTYKYSVKKAHGKQAGESGQRIADVLQSDNINFDRVRFMRAVEGGA